MGGLIRGARRFRPDASAESTEKADFRLPQEQLDMEAKPHYDC